MTSIRSYVIGAASCLVTAALPVVSPSHGFAAAWLAPAADERITAGWVEDVAAALEKDRFKNVFMNQPFGCDQCTILGFLNDAADAMEDGQPKQAKSFINRALKVLDQGRRQGWYTNDDIRPIKRLIIQKANEGLKESGAGHLALSVPRERGENGRYARGDEPLFGGAGEEESYGRTRDRWTGYTEGHPLGLTERLDVDRQTQRRTRQDLRGQGETRQRDRQAMRERDRRQDPLDLDWDRLGPQDRGSVRGSGREMESSRSERGGTARFYSDEFYFPDTKRRGPEDRSSRQFSREEREDTDRRISRDRSLHRQGREQFFEESAPDQPMEEEGGGEQG